MALDKYRFAFQISLKKINIYNYSGFCLMEVLIVDLQV